jgi:hypothetical protein
MQCIYHQFMKMDNKERITTGLEYKQHNDFFGDYFIFKQRAFVLLSECISDKGKIKLLCETLMTLVNYTSNYIDDITEVDKLMNELKRLLQLNKSADVINKAQEILRLLNEKHESSALLPQKQTQYNENEKFWRDEETKAMKQLKKAFYDVFMKK